MSIILTSNQTDGGQDATKKQWIQCQVPVTVSATSAFSVVAWCKTGTNFYTGSDVVDNGWTLLQQMDLTGTGRGWIGFNRDDPVKFNTLEFGIFGFIGGAITPQEGATTLVPPLLKYISSLTADNTWYHVGVTYSGGASSQKVKMYFNGQLAAERTIAAEASAGNLRLGAHKTNSGTTNNNGWKGSISETRFYNRELTADEILTIYATKGKDSIINGMVCKYSYDESPMGTVVTTSDSVGANADGMYMGATYPDKGGGANPVFSTKNKTGVTTYDGVINSISASDTVTYGDRITSLKSVKKRKSS